MEELAEGTYFSLPVAELEDVVAEPPFPVDFEASVDFFGSAFTTVGSESGSSGLNGVILAVVTFYTRTAPIRSSSYLLSSRVYFIKSLSSVILSII